MRYVAAGAPLLQPVSFRVGAPVPALAVTTPAGQPIDLRALKGRVVLVTFWATWCGPCLMEFPIIEKFYKKHHADGFEAVAVSIDEPRTKERAEKILARLPFPGALLHSAHLNGFGIPEFVPQSFVIDARGVMRNWFTRNIEERDLNRSVLPLLKGVAVASDAALGTSGTEPASEDFASPQSGPKRRGF
jgi:cytochrome c biogenesis protein CcmG/thiol:disulfide interchange protein DsbE